MLSELAQLLDCAGDVCDAVTQIRTETDRNPGHGLGIMARPSGPSARPAISWITDVATIGSLT